MRCKHVKICLLFCFLLLIWLKLRLNTPIGRRLNYPRLIANDISTRTIPKEVSELITVVVREFNSKNNDVSLTVQSFKNLLPNVAIWIVYNERPYPPLDIEVNGTIREYNLSPTLTHSQAFLEHLQTPYVLFVPDSTRITSKRPLESMLDAVKNNKHKRMIAVPIGGNVKSLKCLRVNIKPREWTLKYSFTKGSECDAVLGKHVLLMETSFLRQAHDPLILPFPRALYVQMTAQNAKVLIFKSNSLHNGPRIAKSHQKQRASEHLKHFYEQFRFKQVILETGLTTWYGCSKETPNCFGTVVDSTPSYLYEKKWTPPCCMSNLRKTARHTFSVLDESGVRYWLEGGSLLGAMRSGDILPWDYNVDVGFVKSDMARCKWLKRSQNQTVADTKGFVWERDDDEMIFKVSFSKLNKMYVNLIPFILRNGSMTRDSFQTNEFSESFLHPMSSIDFVGRRVPCPNNIRDFLELKYGKGCIENPEYPDPNKIQFP